MYKGAFSGSGTPSKFVVAYRDSLHRRYLRHVIDLVRYWERAKEWERAQACCEDGLELDSMAELLTQRLMTLYQKFGRRAEAKAVYERCRKALAETLNEEPSDETKQIYRLL